MDNEGILARYAAHQRAAGRVESTVQAYKRRLRVFGQWLDKSLLEATREDIEGHLATLKIAPRTRYNYVSRLASFYGWALDEELIVKNPTRQIPRPRRSRDLPRPIPKADLEIAVKFADARMRCWLLLAAFAGLRCKEIAGIIVDDIRRDLDTPTLLISSPKGLTERAVPIHPDLELALAGYGIPRAGWLFPAQTTPGQHVAPWRVSHDGGTYLRGLGINATMHMLRHYFGSAVYGESHDIRLTQELMGHANPATTAGYAQWDQAHAAKVIGGLVLGSKTDDQEVA